VLCILATLIVPTHAFAEPALPRTTQERLLKSLDPLRPGVVVESPWKIGNITIERSQISIELDSGEQTSALLLVHRGTATDTSLTTASFAVQLAPDAPQSQTFIASVERITSLISQGDDGSYFIQIETPREEERPGGGNDLDIGWVLSLLLLLGSALVIRRPGRDTLRLDLPVALALMAVAFALRVTLGPMTFLHENAHGVHFLEQVAGLSFIERPMAGQIALGQFITSLATPTLEALTTGFALVASLQASIAYFIGRSLGIKRTAAGTAGLLVATLPILVRMTASEGAFGPATTFLMLGVLFAVQGARELSGRALIGALVFVAIAGHFRPVMYTAALPVTLTVFLLSPPEERLRWLKRPGLYIACIVFFLCTLDDAAGLIARLDEGSPMTPGWWQGQSLHSWPLVDPVSTPIWFLPMTLIASAFALRGERVREVIWLSVLGTWLTFVYTSDNAWPASLRYAVAYAWLCPVAIGLGLDRLTDAWPRAVGRWSVGGVLLLAASAPLTHHDFISHRFAQQEEIDFQMAKVIPPLLSTKGAIVVTPWPELNHMSGTLNTTPLKLGGVDIVHHTDLEKLRFAPTVFWYRGLACWTKRDSDRDIDVSQMNETCRQIESLYRWKPIATERLNAHSEADWIQVGDGENSVEVGLFQRESVGP